MHLVMILVPAGRLNPQGFALRYISMQTPNSMHAGEKTLRGVWLLHRRFSSFVLQRAEGDAAKKGYGVRSVVGVPVGHEAGVE
jgi:hypothetical protein